MLRELVSYMTRRVAGAEATSWRRKCWQWIETNLRADYAWPGNYRELEQCVKNVLIRRDYRPPHGVRPDPAEELASGHPRRAG